MALNACLIGYGYWGRNLLRNIVETKQCEKIYLVEKDAEKAAEAKMIYPSLEIGCDINSILQDEKVNVVIIATPTPTHFELAEKCLKQKKHVLVEKPATTSLAEIISLDKLATENGCTFMVDHIYLYHPIIRQLKSYFTNDFLGDVHYIDATRINLGIYQKDTNVIWDLACHDIAIVSYLLDQMPTHVQAIGRKNNLHEIEDLAYVFLYYANNLLVQINSSWASPAKMRKIIIGGEKRMIVYDDLEPTNKLIIYDYEHTKNSDKNKSKLADYRLGNISIPKTELKEALTCVLAEFFDCVKQGKQPLANGQNAIAVIRILEKAQSSLFSGGEKISIN
jgi:predicted dehydrogenase